MLLGLARSLTSVLFVYLLEVWQNRAPHFLEHSILLGGLTPASLVKGLRRRCGCCVCHNFGKFRLKSEQVKQRASQKMDTTNIVDMHLEGLWREVLILKLFVRSFVPSSKENNRAKPRGADDSDVHPHKESGQGNWKPVNQPPKPALDPPMWLSVH